MIIHRFVEFSQKDLRIKQQMRNFLVLTTKNRARWLEPAKSQVLVRASLEYLVYNCLEILRNP